MEINENGYTIDGKFYRRVTSLIKEYGLYPDYPAGGNAMEFGKNVHKACELWDKGVLDMDTLDPALVPYLEQWKAIIKRGYLWTYIEHTVVSKTYGYAGTLDRAVNNCIYDIKTGYPASWHGVQLALYKIAYQEQEHIKVRDMYCVYINADNYRLIKYNKKSDMAVALAILTIKNWKER